MATATASGGVVSLPNTATLVPGAGRDPVRSNEVRTIYGALRLHKVDSANGRSLAGTTFALYRTREDGQTQRDALATSAASGADGIALLPGVHVTDVANGRSANDSYWVFETEAPAGYVADRAPVQVQLLHDGTTVGADASGGKPVLNERSLIADLPVSGGDVAGLLGAGLVRDRRRGRRAKGATPSAAERTQPAGNAETPLEDDRPLA